MRQKLTGDELTKAIEEAKKDPQFMKDIDAFIEASLSVYKVDD